LGEFRFGQDDDVIVGAQLSIGTNRYEPSDADRNAHPDVVDVITEPFDAHSSAVDPVAGEFLRAAHVAQLNASQIFIMIAGLRAPSRSSSP